MRTSTLAAPLPWRLQKIFSEPLHVRVEILDQCGGVVLVFRNATPREMATARLIVNAANHYPLCRRKP